MEFNPDASGSDSFTHFLLHELLRYMADGFILDEAFSSIESYHLAPPSTRPHGTQSAQYRYQSDRESTERYGSLQQLSLKLSMAPVFEVKGGQLVG
jgi:hypothetical protein